MGMQMLEHNYGLWGKIQLKLQKHRRNGDDGKKCRRLTSKFIAIAIAVVEHVLELLFNVCHWPSLWLSNSWK